MKDLGQSIPVGPSADFCWRGFIRAVDSPFLPPKDGDNLRRHSQVYLDSKEYMW